MADEGGGTCPHCEGGPGLVFAPCPEVLCSRKGYRFIPSPWFESAREFASRHRRPIDPLLGRLLDKYFLCGVLGEGGMGAVYLALQMPLRREVALKVISGLQLNEAAVARFEREARAISVLDHPNIVKLYDYGVGELDYPIPYMVLEYVRHGRTLGESLARVRDENGGSVPIPTIQVVFRQILHALATAHKVGIIHRDMKPENVMIAPVEGQPYFVKILDFGLAKAVVEATGGDVAGGRDPSGVSRTGQILGTPYYMAPEQAPVRGRPHADARSDLYAVGVMIFEVFTGIRAYDGRTPLEVLMKKSDPAYRPLNLPEVRSLPPPLVAFLDRAMAVDPANRFSSADEMLQAFEALLSKTKAVAKGPVFLRSSADRPLTPPSEDSATRAYEEVGPHPPQSPPLELTRSPGWVLAAFRSREADEIASEGDVSSVVPADRPRWRAWRWAVASVAVVATAMAAWVAFRPSSTPAPDVVTQSSPEKGESLASPQPDTLSTPDIGAVSMHVDSPSTQPVTHSFVIDTAPRGAQVEVEGRVLGAAPVTYEFTAAGDDWRDREVTIRASGAGLSPSAMTVVLSRAVEQGRIEVRLEPALRPRGDRRAKTVRGLDKILGPDVEPGRILGAPSERLEQPEGPLTPPSKEPPPEKPPQKPSIPML